MAGRPVYLDGSVVLRRILRQSEAIQQWGDRAIAVTSELMVLEANRTLDRLRLLHCLSETELAGCWEDLALVAAAAEVFPVTPAVVRRAGGPLPAPLGSLDSLHLATALTWMEAHLADLTLLTHDRQLAVCARASGLAVGP
jgi:predicted nucleic acid-binding protein